jgi:hypothetical protein
MSRDIGAVAGVRGAFAETRGSRECDSRHCPEEACLILSISARSGIFRRAGRSGAVSSQRWIGLILTLLCAASALAAGPIESRIATTTLSLPQLLEGYTSSRCTWDPCSLGPRLYLAPRVNGSFLVGWTDNSGNGHVSVVSGSAITATHTFSGRKIRGLVAHGDGTYGVLLKEGVILYLSKRAANGSQIWIANLNGSLTEDSSPLGDHRLAYGNGLYAAYWAVHGVSGWVAGHEGDQLQYVNDSGALQGGGWSWGCSHSMAELVGFHTGDQRFTNFCSTDCYPDPPGLKMNHSTNIQTGAGDCRGGVSLQLGQMAQAENGWKVVFNAENPNPTVNSGVGLATAGGSNGTTVVWLTDTNGRQESDPVLARLGTQTPPRYLVGWKTLDDRVFHIGLVNDSGAFLEGPESMQPGGPGWGLRDDSFKTTPDGGVAWLEGNVRSPTLKLHRYTASTLFADGFEAGDTGKWSSTSN